MAKQQPLKQHIEYSWDDEIHCLLSLFRLLITKRQHIQDEGHLYAPSALSLNFLLVSWSRASASRLHPSRQHRQQHCFTRRIASLSLTNRYPPPCNLITCFWGLNLAHKVLKPGVVSEHWGSTHGVLLNKGGGISYHLLLSYTAGTFMAF